MAQAERSRFPARSITERPPVRRPPSGPPRFDPDKYPRALQQFLHKLLSEFIRPTEVVDGLVNERTMGTWIKAFTHISFSMNNYEALETIGDASLEIGFYDYVMKSLPNVDDPSTYDELRNYYMSKHFQGKTSVGLGFMKYLRKDPVIPDLNSIAEDLFESFSGALFALGNQNGEELVGVQIGQNLVSNFVAFIFNGIAIDLERRHGSYKTQLETMGKQLGIKIDYTSRSFQHQAVGAWHTNKKDFIRLLEDLIARGEIKPTTIKDIYERDNISKSLSIEPALILGFANTGTQADVQNESAKRALAFFYDLGISRDVADALQRQKLDEGTRRNVSSILGKYKNVKIRQIKSAAEDLGYTIYLLIGYYAEGNAETIASLYEKKTVPYDEIRKRLYELGREKVGSQ